VTIRKPIFVVPLDLGTVVCSTAEEGYSAGNLNRHKAIGLVWKTTGSGSIWARGRFDKEHAIDFCGMIAANAQPGTDIRLRLGATQAEVDGSSAAYDSGALDFISPSITSDNGLYHSHLELDSPIDATWWRIDITGHTGVFQAADLVLGRKVESDRFYNLDFEFGLKDMGSIEFTRFGVANEQEGVIWRTAAFTLAWESEATYYAKWEPIFKALGLRGVIWMSFDPEPGPYRQSKTFMGWFEKLPISRGVRKPGVRTSDYSIVSFI
jgi:hypothetical protein